MKTTIVCGMLGSGKTTFIRNRLSSSVGKTVVLVNDFGQAGIDGEIFSADGIEAIELPSGCVCCTLKFDMMTTLTRIRDHFRPDHLYIEPSGVASPSAVIESLESLKIAPYSVIGMIDAIEFPEFYESEMYGRFFTDQIATSDLILVNKTDIAKPEMTEKSVSILEEINPHAIVIRTIQGVPEGGLPVTAPKERKPSQLPPHLQFESISLALQPGMPRRKIEQIFSSLAQGSFGSVIRAKALVQSDAGPLRADLASGVVDIAGFGHDVSQGRLVVIGRGLDQGSICAALQ